MSGPRFEIGERVWHPAQADNGIAAGYGNVMTRQAKSAHTAHMEGFLYRLRSDESMNSINFNFDENDLKKAEDAEKEEQEQIQARDKQRKEQLALQEQLKTGGSGVGSGVTTIQTTVAGTPPANPQVTGGPISTTGLVTHQVASDSVAPGTPGTPIPANTPPKEETKAGETEQHGISEGHKADKDKFLAGSSTTEQLGKNKADADKAKADAEKNKQSVVGTDANKPLIAPLDKPASPTGTGTTSGPGATPPSGVPSGVKPTSPAPGTTGNTSTPGNHGKDGAASGGTTQK